MKSLIEILNESFKFRINRNTSIVNEFDITVSHLLLIDVCIANMGINRNLNRFTIDVIKLDEPIQHKDEKSNEYYIKGTSIIGNLIMMKPSKVIFDPETRILYKTNNDKYKNSTLLSIFLHPDNMDEFVTLIQNLLANKLYDFVETDINEAFSGTNIDIHNMVKHCGFSLEDDDQLYRCEFEEKDLNKLLKGITRIKKLKR